MKPTTEGDPANDPLIGTQLAAYEIVDVLGRGGYSVVYRARQVPLQRDVALKILTTKETGIIEDQVAAFLNEARIAAMLDHPCLLNIHDVIEVDGRHGMAMELVTGGDLARHLKTHGPMPWREALPIVRDVARALACAHEHGLAHRDVKPANVLLTGEGGAKLADLGLTDGRTHAGTAAFMAPEQILRRKTGKRTDIYSLGCTMFAALTGRAPFASDSSKRMLKAHLHDEPPRLRDLVDVPQELEDLVDEMLEKDPADRPASIEVVIDRLDGIEARADRPPVRPRRAAHRRRPRQREASPGKWILILIVVGALLAGGLWAWRQFGPLLR